MFARMRVDLIFILWMDGSGALNWDMRAYLMMA